VSAEQVARDFVMNMTDVEKTKAVLTPDAMAGGVLHKSRGDSFSNRSAGATWRF
jgi:hypothetical protein